MEANEVIWMEFCVQAERVFIKLLIQEIINLQQQQKLLQTNNFFAYSIYHQTSLRHITKPTGTFIAAEVVVR